MAKSASPRKSPAKRSRPKKAVAKSNGASAQRNGPPQPQAEPGDPSAATSLSFPVVGIGASAGGFEALITLLKRLPTDTGMAFIVVMHLDPRHKSKLTELIARGTSMAVREIRDGMPIAKNEIHVLPANHDVVLAGARLQLIRRSEAERIHMPVDRLFTSLAEQHGPRTIGVVLSGTGSDGTLGLTAIKAEGGITFAEAEASAKYFGMPGSAIDAGCVDSVLPAEALAAELARIAQHPLLRPQKTEPAEPFPHATDALGKIFVLLKRFLNVDFSLYKHSTLKRRISRRMVLQRIERLDDYAALLRSNPEELEALFHDLLIHVTSFFRDKKVFAALKQRVVPRLLKGKLDGSELRVWVPGCATGEEVYSLAICLSEEIAKANRNVKLQLFGTDLSEVAIGRARAGLFAPSIAKDVSPERLERFFTKATGGYQISRVIRDMCTFARQNVCEDPPFSRLDLISCRNVLIYLGPELQKKCFPVFHYALNPGGFLILGTSETLGAAGDLFTIVDKRNKIYVRKQVPTTAALEFAGLSGFRVDFRPKLEMPRPVAGHEPVNLQAEADRIILSQYAPAGVVIDAHLRVHEFRGRTGRFLEHAPGAATLNLLQMVRASLVVDLRTAIHQAQKDEAPVRKEGVLLKINARVYDINLEVVPFKVPHSDERWMLVLFEEVQAGGEAEAKTGAARHAKGKPDAGDAEVHRLRRELAANKESLQALLEEQEATNEELKSSNEEIESSNEELQSTNEELETAKEELQSTNEELTTLNEELSNQNMEVAQVNNDLTNLLSSINIPIVMVDNNLTVRRATPLAEKLFNLTPADTGRRLSHFKPNLTVANIDKLIAEVLDSLTTRESKVQDTNGHWYSMRIRPYRTRDNKIDGAVLALVDIDEEQRQIARLALATSYTEAILETAHEPLVILDGGLRVRKASRAFYETFKLGPKKIYGIHFCEIGAGEWDIHALRQLLQQKLLNSDRVENLTADLVFKHLGRRTLAFSARRVQGEKEPIVVLAIADVTQMPPAPKLKK
jgi:two-component system CheB/CheR fusion protein